MSKITQIYLIFKIIGTTVRVSSSPIPDTNNEADSVSFTNLQNSKNIFLRSIVVSLQKFLNRHVFFILQFNKIKLF